jgi:two-component system, cell cycle response regulator
MRILVVDDDPLTLEPLVRRLQLNGHDVMSCSDGEAAWAALSEGPQPSMVILDWMMPGMDGIELCRRIRSRTNSPYVYLVMMTGRADPEDLLAGFEAGVDDYLVKPFDWNEMDARVRAGQRIVDLQNELIEARETLRIQAMKDPLTQALNHGAIVDRLLAEVDRAHRESWPVSVILADLDNFKRVNDAYGHVVGDQVLIEVSRRMTKSLRSQDALGRYGGEEFLIVLPDTGPKEAIAAAERIREAVSDEPFRLGSTDILVTVSQGVTTWTAPRLLPPQRLIQAADRALYAVKDAGRDHVKHVRFDPDAYDSAPTLVAVPGTGT